MVAVVDLFAHCRRRGIALLPAARSLRSRLAFWLFVGLAFTAFRVLGAWPAGVPRPPNPAVATSGDWPVLALLALGVVALAGWIVARHRLVPRRAGRPRRAARGRDGGAARARHRFVARSGNKPVRVDLLPARDARLALAAAGAERHGRLQRALVFLVGLIGPLLIVLLARACASASASTRRGICSSSSRSATCTCRPSRSRCAAPRARRSSPSVAAGRYAPYPPAGERPARGPLRELVRHSRARGARPQARNRGASPRGRRVSAQIGR